MAAIITEQFRRNNTQTLINDVAINSYYIAIGQQDKWDDTISDNDAAPFPLGTYGDEQRALEHLTGLFKLTSSNTSTVIPRNDYDPTSIYKLYDPFDPTCFYGCDEEEGDLKPCYVTVGNKLFLLIYKDIQFAAAGNITDFEETNQYGWYWNNSRNHLWAFIGEYNENASINTGSFISVDNTLSIEAENTANNGGRTRDITGGVVLGFNVINGGNLYRHWNNANEANQDVIGENLFTEVPGKLIGLDLSGNAKQLDVLLDINVITGDLTSSPPDETATITSISFSASNQEEHFPFDINDRNADKNAAGFSKCKLVIDPTFNDGSEPSYCRNFTETVTAAPLRQEVVVIPKLSPVEGFGTYRLQTLPSWYIGFFVDTANCPQIPNNTSYHQIMLLKNPKSIYSEFDSPTMNPTQIDLGLLSKEFIVPLSHFTYEDVGELQQIPLVEGREIGPGWRIKQNDLDVGVIAHIQTIDSDATQTPIDPFKYFYYNDHKYGYNKLDPNEFLSFESPDTLYSDEVDVLIDSFVLSEYKPGTGTILFEDNRGGILREEGQNEELKIIIQL